MESHQENKMVLNFLKEGSVYKLLELLDDADLSERELEELSFDMNCTYSRFFDIGLVQTWDDKIIFYCNECGGYFCETMYALELNDWPNDCTIQAIRDKIKKIDRIGSRVYNLTSKLDWIKEKLDVKTMLENKFQKEETIIEAKNILRSDIKSKIKDQIGRFRMNYRDKIKEEDLEDIINTIRSEYLL